MYPPDRRGLFTTTFDRIVELVSEDQRVRARKILERRDFLPEFLFYTTLGRADLVLFDAFRRESFLSFAARAGNDVNLDANSARSRRQ